MPAAPSAMARSRLAQLHLTATGCESPNEEAVDLWTTLRVAHRVHSLNNNRPERNENCVTHVVGLNCYLCPRLLTSRRTQDRLFRVLVVIVAGGNDVGALHPAVQINIPAARGTER